LLAGAGAQQRAGSGGESHGERAIADQLQLERPMEAGRRGDGT
jgi:hypothetical protein